jgi:hypothetical protein
MERFEFETWTEAHRRDLVKRAYAKRYLNPEDTAQGALARMAASFHKIPLHLAWPWACSALRGVAHNEHRAARRRRALFMAKKADRAGAIRSGRKASAE